MVRRGMKQIKQGRFKLWSDAKHELGTLGSLTNAQAFKAALPERLGGKSRGV